MLITTRSTYPGALEAEEVRTQNTPSFIRFSTLELSALLSPSNIVSNDVACSTSPEFETHLLAKSNSGYSDMFGVTAPLT